MLSRSPSSSRKQECEISPNCCAPTVARTRAASCIPDNQIWISNPGRVRRKACAAVTFRPGARRSFAQQVSLSFAIQLKSLLFCSTKRQTCKFIAPMHKRTDQRKRRRGLVGHSEQHQLVSECAKMTVVTTCAHLSKEAEPLTVFRLQHDLLH